MYRHLVTRLVATVAVALATATAALAQGTFPARPLRIVVPLQAGGPTDFLARSVAQPMADALGQPVVVENKPGADGLIAAREVIAASPDGHTLLFAIASMVATPLLARPPAFDWAAELAPVGRVARVGFAMAVHPDVPARTVAEFVAYAKANPDRLNFATSTLGELMAAAQFMRATGIAMNRVPYKGGAQAMPDLLAGRVQVLFGPVSLIAPQVQAGSLRALATLLPQRSPALPNVPTMAEAGHAEVSVPTWQAVFVPARTPPAVAARLADALATALAKPTVRADIEKRAIFFEPGTAADLGAAIVRDQDAWLRLIADYRLGNE